jgi:hypothetical protein
MLWGVAVGVIVLVVLLLGLYSCRGPIVTPPAASSSPVTSVVTSPATTAGTTPPTPVTTSSTPPGSGATTTPPTAAGTSAPLTPTAVEAGSGGRAGEARGPGVGGLALGAAGLLLAASAVVTLVRRRSRP